MLFLIASASIIIIFVFGPKVLAQNGLIIYKLVGIPGDDSEISPTRAITEGDMYCRNENQSINIIQGVRAETDLPCPNGERVENIVRTRAAIGDSRTRTYHDSIVLATFDYYAITGFPGSVYCDGSTFDPVIDTFEDACDTGYVDIDGDGWSTLEGDCDDFDPYIYPDAPCSELQCGDQNCNGEMDCFDVDCMASPVVIDVAGNGFNLTNNDRGVNFDLNSNGKAEKLPWTSANSDDAWLALDRNGNNKFDNGTELFGNFTPQPTPPAGMSKNGFIALAEYDKTSNGGNNDGEISNQDSIFSSLRLWQDKNHNGISENSEIYTLSALNVIKIELDYRESRRTDEHGNQFKYRAKVKDAQGAEVGRWAWDVFLNRTP